MGTTMLTIAETAAWFKERDNFLVLTHRRPDGDTLGSAGALVQGLREAGKTAHALYNPETTPRYARFVEGCWAPDGYISEHIVTVDTASCSLSPLNGEEYFNAVSLCIDHHPSNTHYAEQSCLKVDAASCGEIVYKILMALSDGISAKSAERLYVAVSTDTGCFLFGNTTADTLRVASLLVEAGAPHRQLNKLLFRTKTRSRTIIESMIYSGLEFYFDGAVAISTITRAMMESSNANEDDLDDIASLPGSVEGVIAGITLREMASARDCKVSVRTSQSVDAHAISSHFGGGGHKFASGFTVEKTLAEVKEELLEILGACFAAQNGN